MSIPIVPAIIPRSEGAVIEATRTFRFSHEYHLDIVDGVFVKSISWPYEPEGEPLSVKAHTDKYTLEVDLMVSNPVAAAKEWIKAGADMLVFHVETIDVATFKDFARFDAPKDVSLGVSFSGDTSREALLPYLEYADYIQVMGIHTIGLQGQPFAEATLDHVRFFKEEYPQLPVSVDGSVNENTVERIVKAGADRLIVGSAIVGQSDMEAAYKKLRTIVDAL